ncbi:MAG TPA: hypothetical protein VF715_01860 [Thermoleophilaceae bacterium]
MTVLGLAAVLAVAGGCGGDDGGDGGGGGGSGGGSGGSTAADERAARGALNDYIAALVDNDPEAACAKQTERAQRDAADEVPGAGSCERAHEVILSALGPKVKELDDQLAKALTKIEVSGDTATLTSPKDPGAEMKLRREGGEWKIDDKVVTYTPN